MKHCSGAESEILPGEMQWGVSIKKYQMERIKVRLDKLYLSHNRRTHLLKTQQVQDKESEECA